MAAYKPTSWREQRVEIKPETHETIYFNDTNPNHILIANSSANPIFIGVSAIADAQTYDMIIPGYGTRLYPRMQGTSRIYVYSESTENTIIQVTSWEGEFDPSSIPQSQEMVAGGSDGLLGIVDINNFMQPLPPGDNFIGSVSLENPLPAGSNHLGSVTVEGGGQDYTETLESLRTDLVDLYTIVNEWFRYGPQYGGSGDGGGGGGGGAQPTAGDIMKMISFGTEEMVVGETYDDFGEFECYEYNDFNVIISSDSEPAAKIKVDVFTSGFLMAAGNPILKVGSYTWDKPAGAATIYLNSKEIPALDKNLQLLKLEVSTLDQPVKAACFLTGVRRT